MGWFSTADTHRWTQIGNGERANIDPIDPNDPNDPNGNRSPMGSMGSNGIGGGSQLSYDTTIGYSDWDRWDRGPCVGVEGELKLKAKTDNAK